MSHPIPREALDAPTGPIELPMPLSFTGFQAAVSSSFVPLKLTTADPERFRASLTQATVGDVSFSDVRAAAHEVERTPELIRSSPRKYFKLSLQMEGASSLEQNGRTVVLEPGDMAIYDTSTSYLLSFDTPFRVMVIQLPHDRLDIPSETMRDMTGVLLAGSHGLGRVVSPFLATLGTNMDELSGPAGARLAQNAVDLLEMLFANELDVARAAADPRRALMQRIRDHIDEHLGDPELTPSSIAAAHFISTRHLHALFHEQGSTVAGYVRSRRLEQCYLNLTNPLFVDTPIATVGVRWGFGDAAHFSRVFKSAYGESPTQVRRRVLGQQAARTAED